MDNKVCLNCKTKDSLSKSQVPYKTATAGKSNTRGEFSDSTENVPDWSKKVGNYSPYPKELTCDKAFSLKDREKFEKIEPEITEGIQIRLDVGEANRESWVYLWASMPSKDPLVILGPGEAYEGDINRALVQCDKSGKASCMLNCPQPYRVDDKTYCRHVHYVVEDKLEEIWQPMRTLRIVCQISLEGLDDVLKTKKAMVINSLPKEMYDKDKIPKSLNFPRETLDKLSEEVKSKRVLSFLKDHLKDYPEIQKRVVSKSLELKDVPLVIYCYDENCKSSGRLIDHFYEVGVNNVLEFGPGVKGWQKERIFFESDDEDADEDEESDAETEDAESETEDATIDAEDSDSSDESDEESSEEESDPDLKDIIYEGIGYYLRDDGSVLNDNFDVVGKARMKDGECVNIKWSSKQDKKEHIRQRDGETPEDDDVSDEEPEEPEEPEPQEEEPEAEEPEAEEPEAEEPEPHDEDDETDSSDEDTPEELYEYDDRDLRKKKLPELREMVKQLGERPGSTVMYPLGKKGLQTKDEIIGLIVGCQGKPTKVKSTYKFLSAEDLRQKSLQEVKDIVKEMTERDPDTYKHAFSKWRKGQLIGFILSCRGTQIKSQKSKKKVQRGFGWGYGF